MESLKYIQNYQLITKVTKEAKRREVDR